ncbi:DUF4157 domain-containing protein, partial [Streptomyces olivoreticuli]
MLRQRGLPLPLVLRQEMEIRLGADFSDVRVHADEQAQASAHAVDAHAYTSGHHIVLADSQALTPTPSGRHLLGHELTHVLQQRQGPAPGTPTPDGLTISNPHDPLEQAAQSAILSRQEIQRRSMDATRSVGQRLTIQRTPKGKSISDVADDYADKFFSTREPHLTQILIPEIWQWMQSDPRHAKEIRRQLRDKRDLEEFMAAMMTYGVSVYIDLLRTVKEPDRTQVLIPEVWQWIQENPSHLNSLQARMSDDECVRLHIDLLRTVKEPDRTQVLIPEVWQWIQENPSHLNS